MERKHFLHTLAHVVAAPTIFSSLAFNKLDFSSNSFLSNTIEEGRIIVIIRMNGGNDGLNTVIPLDQMSALSNARPHVILPENKIVSLGSNDVGLHPALSDFKTLFNEDRLKIIQNVGYPTPDFSHFRSTDIWQSASDSDEYFNSGWLARYIEDKHPTYPEAYPTEKYPHPLAVEINGGSSMLFTGEKSFTSFQAGNPSNFQEIINEFDNEYPSDNKGNKLKYLQLIAKQSMVYSKIVKEKYENGSNTVTYGNSNLERQLEIVSQLINGGLKSRVYLVEFGGFDTHDTQVDQSDRTKGEHASLLKELNDAVTTFIKNLDASGLSDNVLAMTFSEFGRTIVSNGSGGTDHGTAAPMFIFGNKVNPEVLGANPLIPANASWQDNLEAEFDFRQVYTSLINQWMGGGGTRAKDVLFKDFEELSIVGDQYIDTDNDGVADMNDSCPNTLSGAIVGLDGCEIFSLPRDNYSIQVLSASCIGSKNGVLKITAADTSYVYKVLVSGVAVALELTSANGHEVQVSDLGVGTYTIDISITEKEGYLQTFEVSVREPAPLQAKANVDYFNKKANLFLEGSELYFVTVNGKELVATENGFEVALKVGNNVIKVSTPLECQGVYEEVVFVSEKVTFYPNPVVNELHIVIPGIDTESLIQVYDTSGNEVINTKNAIFFNRELDLNMGGLHSGIYIVKVNGKTVRETFKIMKQ